MSTVLGAFILVLLLEMGDKSQLMAFTLATRYRPATVMVGVFFATLVVNGIPIYLGAYFAEALDLDAVRLASAAIFIAFGAWSLLGSGEGPGADRELPVNGRTRSLLSIIILFIVAETGDKTQISSAVYAATYQAPFLTLVGVMGGMLLADGLGIYLGHRVRCLISPEELKLAVSGVFLALGGINLLAAPQVAPAYGGALLALYVVLLGKYAWDVRAGAGAGDYLVSSPLRYPRCDESTPGDRHGQSD